MVRGTRHFRPTAPAAVLVALLGLVGCAGNTDSAEEPGTSPIQTSIRTEGPHVILVTLCASRVDRMSAYGYERSTTPNLERLAAESTLYENAITPGTWTVPAHASMFTGLYPRDHGANAETPQLGREFTTLAEYLWSAGYATAAGTNNANVSGRAGLLQGFEDSIPLYKSEGNYPDEGAEATNRWIFDWLDGRSGSEQRFFLYVNYIEPSLPHQPPPSYEPLYLDEATDPESVAEVRSWKRPRDFAYMFGVPGMEIEPAQFEIMSNLYDAELTYLDSRLGELRDGLEQRGLLDDTLLIVTADQGEHLGEHGMLEHKMSLYEQLVRVPLIVRYPARFPTGRRVAAHVQSIDLFPTILELCDVEFEGAISGRPLPVDDGDGRNHTFAHFADPSAFLVPVAGRFPGTDIQRFQRSIEMVRGSRYKLIRGSHGPVELYDLAGDPGEQHNVAGERPQVRAELEQLLERFENGKPEF